MLRCLVVAVASALLLAACTHAPLRTAELSDEVRATETAFAKTMADRDHAAFANFIAEDAVFLGGATPLRGKREIAAAWSRYFDKPAAPFSWRPESVEVLESGQLALTSGPVYNPAGKLVGSFTSIWRREAPNTWRIVFDTGNEACEGAKP